MEPFLQEANRQSFERVMDKKKRREKGKMDADGTGILRRETGEASDGHEFGFEAQRAWKLMEVDEWEPWNSKPKVDAADLKVSVEEYPFSERSQEEGTDSDCDSELEEPRHFQRLKQELIRHRPQESENDQPPGPSGTDDPSLQEKEPMKINPAAAEQWLA